MIIIVETNIALTIIARLSSDARSRQTKLEEVFAQLGTRFPMNHACNFKVALLRRCASTC
jgi:hypothetical protein